MASTTLSENGQKDVDSSQGSTVVATDPELKLTSVLPPPLARLVSSAVSSALDAGECEDFPELEESLGEFSASNPLFVFINPKSGGRLGGELYKALCSFIGPSQVFDLSKVKKPGLVITSVMKFLEDLAEKKEHSSIKSALQGLRILVAGGDGTVGWILSSVSHLPNPPPVGVIPLGTGNDLSRAYGWLIRQTPGPGFPSANSRLVKARLLEGAAANVVNLDCWKIRVIPSSDTANEHSHFPHGLKPVENKMSEERNEPISYEGYFYNYFSFGMDAQIAYGFHRLREEKPWLARGRVANKAIYSGFGCSQGWFCVTCSSSQKIRTIHMVAKISVKKQGSDEWEDIKIPPEVRALVFLNLQSYAGGRNPWGNPNEEEMKKNNWSVAKPNDGLLEIVGLQDGWHTALVMAKLSPASRLGQAHSVRLELHGEYRAKAYLQVDGEPWRQPLSGEESTIVEISYSSKSIMLLGKNASGLAD